MDELRLRAILDAYGAESARWPEAERQAALQLLSSNPDLVRAQDDAAVLDRLIAKAPAGEVNEALLTRILESAPRPMAKAQSPRWPGRIRFLPSFDDLIHVPMFGGGAIARPVAILTLAVCIGLGAGALLPAAVDSGTPSDVEMLSAMWGNSVVTPEGASW